MSEKENKKSRLSEILFVLLLIVICVMGIAFYKLHEINVKRQLEVESLIKRVQELEKNVNDKDLLDLGDYFINEVKEDEAGVTNEECSVRVMKENKFHMYLNWGIMLDGTYEIKDNKLICTAEELSWEGGAGPGSEECKDILTFEILENNTLKLLSVDIKNQENENKYLDGFVIGYTYTKK